MLLKKRMKSGHLDQSRNRSGLSDCWSRSQRHGQYFENINDISSIFPIFYRYISDIYQYFTGNSSPRACEIHFRYFGEISAIFLIFSLFFSRLAKLYWYWPISDISAISWPIKPIFSSLLKGMPKLMVWIILYLLPGCQVDFHSVIYIFGNNSLLGTPT